MSAQANGRTVNGVHHGAQRKPLNVIVVGGSLGGLAAGLALKRNGHNVTILERNPTSLLHNQGAGIVAGGDTLEFFERYDRCTRPIAVNSYGRQYFGKDGNIVHKADTAGVYRKYVSSQHANETIQLHTMTSWDLAYYLLRANFDGVRSEYCDLPPSQPTDGQATHLHGHKVTGFQEQADGLKVDFERTDGSRGSITGDFLIGADGPSSTIRKILKPQVERTYAGYCALRGTMLEIEATPAAKKVLEALA